MKTDGSREHSRHCLCAPLCEKEMKEYHCVTQTGEYFMIHQNNEDRYLCPVCGSPEFTKPPYDQDGLASFQMCSCGFEFGYDDSNIASIEAVENIVPNWDRWRLKVIEKNMCTKSKLLKLEYNLRNIGYKLAFDLIPVKIDDKT
jgi:hypothetical protein